ncbi:MAG: plastocyanin/azurin family copper-binding protein [Actinomycetota bacterium]|nr:plastocyanin/azurin family copper-binding protein [Actinomycetota bacterium]
MNVLSRSAVVLLLAGVVAAGASMASAAPIDAGVVNGTIVAGPGAFISPGTYATPYVIVLEGQQATFYNADVAPHDVVSVEKKRKRPLFRSKLIGLGQSAPVVGSEKLAPGTYAFFCSKHHWMTAQLVVLP